MKKLLINSGGINKTIVYSPEKRSYSAPIIVSTENGVHTLNNGNTITVAKYNAMWLPQKQKVMPIGYKGENPDKTLII